MWSEAHGPERKGTALNGGSPGTEVGLLAPTRLHTQGGFTAGTADEDRARRCPDAPLCISASQVPRGSALPRTPAGWGWGAGGVPLVATAGAHRSQGTLE